MNKIRRLTYETVELVNLKDPQKEEQQVFDFIALGLQSAERAFFFAL